MSTAMRVTQQASVSSRAACRTQRLARPACRSTRKALNVTASAVKPEVSKALATVATVSSCLAASTAQAATEISQVAAGDNRLSILATLFVPALGWVAFNIFGPAKNQIDRMDEIRNGLVGAVGLSALASLVLADQAQAATELSQLAASDNRLAILGTLFLPALGWVAFNIFGPAKNQIDRMDENRNNGLVGAAGVGALASLFVADQAQAATELSQLAASDNRLAILGTLFLPALGWVAFNIFGPAKNQIDRMDENRNNGLVGAAGLGALASLFLVDQAQAAAEISQLAASDNRLGILATLFVPALGWVAFNILQPAKNQIDRMDEIRRE